MRVMLVGRTPDRERVRAGLLAAGFEVVAESAVAPDAQSLAPSVDAIIIATETPGQRTRPPDVHRRAPEPEPLTPREHDVLALLAEGLPNKAIADALGISDQTVKFHVAAIIAKLGATNRTDAVRRAIRRGLVAI